MLFKLRADGVSDGASAGPGKPLPYACSCPPWGSLGAVHQHPHPFKSRATRCIMPRPWFSLSWQRKKEKRRLPRPFSCMLNKHSSRLDRFTIAACKIPRICPLFAPYARFGCFAVFLGHYCIKAPYAHFSCFFAWGGAWGFAWGRCLAISPARARVRAF